MKTTLQTLFFALILLPVTLSASDILDNIASAISSGNAASISKYFDTNVDIVILDKTASYSKAQAQMVVQDFFTKNPVKRFTLIHRGSSAQGQSYGIGTLETSSQSFRVYFLVKQKAGSYLLEAIHFKQK